MTPAAVPDGTDEHPDVAEISGLADGLLPQERSAQIRAHLEQCPLCDDVHEALEDIRNTLGTLPGPTRMPADVAGRIEAALAAEALLDASTPYGTPDSPHSPDSPDTASTPSAIGNRSDRTASARPIEVSRETTRRSGSAERPPGHAAASTGPGRGSRARRRWRSSLLITAGVATVFGLGGVLLPSVTGTGTDSDPGSAVRKDTAGDSGGTDGLQRRVQALVDAQQPGLKEQPPSAETGQSPDVDSPLAGGAASVPTCVRNGIDRPERPLAADASKRYEGRPSYLVVLPHPGDPQRVDAYVVDSACASGEASGPGEILVQRTFPRE